MDKETMILQLIKKIDHGAVSASKASKELEMIEQKCGSLDLLFDVEDRNDSEYYNELLTNARMGLYNKESIIKMAEIMYDEKKTITKWIVVAAAVIVVVIAVILIAKGGNR